MADLSSLPINISYPGVLNLETATTGITQSVQALQDGLGNDTGVQIAENRFEGANIFNVYRPAVAKYYGNGIGTTTTPPAGSQNVLSQTFFYDNGLHSYSAFTMNCLTLGAGESVDVAFYNAQYHNTYGYIPYQRLTAVYNVDATSTGFKTIAFTSGDLSFSGTGPGFYFMIVRFNAGGTPACRFAQSGIQPSFYFPNGMLMWNNGFVLNNGGSQYISAFNTAGTSATQINTNIYSLASFPTTWTGSDSATLTSTSTINFTPGFILHTIR